VLVGSFFAAVGVGSLGAFLVLGYHPPVLPPAAVPPSPPPIEAVVVVPTSDPEPAAEPEPKQEAEATDPEVASPQVKPAAQPHEKPKPRPKETAHSATEQAAPVVGGEGRLRIGTMPASAVTRILVGSDDWGPAPVDRKIPSGQYVVTVRTPDGKKSSAWKGPVMPDHTTVLFYDLETARWQLK
jgi:outer membrane biosynthesis protein TonB